MDPATLPAQPGLSPAATQPDTAARSERQFAFGSFAVDGCRCPLIAATNQDPCGTSDLVPVYRRYDEYLRRKLNREQGIVPEAVAREAWLWACDEAKGLSPAHERGLEVARLLDWAPGVAA